MSETSEAREIHLVGSIPLSDAEAVFRAVGGTLGASARRIPDGETGPARSLWVQCQIPFLLGHPQLEMVEPDPERPAERRTARIRSGGVYSTKAEAIFTGKARVRAGIAVNDLRFDNLGYADWALESWSVFSRLQDVGAISAATRFQVCIPSPSVVPNTWVEPDQRDVIGPAYERGLLHEIERIAQVIPHDRLAIQFDCIEPIQIAALSSEGRASVIETFVRLGSAVPSTAELGYHLCYGDFEHRHEVEPKDLGDVVAIANELTVALARQIDFIHMPVPRDRDDEDYFAPLRTLRLADRTKLILGLIHYGDGVEGARRRMTAADSAREDYGIATECGLGRRDPDSIIALLGIHLQAAKL